MYFFALFAQDNVRINKISIFTDGNSYIEKTINLTPKNNEFIITDALVPRARFGTLLITDKENSIKNLKSYLDSIRTPKLLKVLNTSLYADMLKANLNKRVTIASEEKIREGEIVELIYSSYGNITHVLLQEGSKYDLIRIQDIISISFPSKPMVPYSKIPSKESYAANDKNELKLNLMLEFDNSKPKEVYMNYLQRGISWTPFYYLELDDNRNRAKLTLKAEVINDSEEIKETDIHLFIGEPNFKYSSHLTDLVDFKNLLNPNYDAGRSQPGLSNSYSLNEAVAISGYAHNQNRVKNYQDYYVYKVENESLKKNSRAHYHLFETELEYRHIYVCDLLNINHQINSNRKEENKIYHNIHFVNTTENLMGKGSVTIIDDTDQQYIPLAQSKIEYTPSGAIGLIEITESPEIEVLEKEEVLESDEKKIQFFNRSYRRTRIRAVVKIKNYKDEKIEIKLRKEVFGDVMEDSSFSILEKKEKYYLPNAINQLEWNLYVNPGEEKKLVYEYEYFRS